jgi:inhibitor of cysteine peptidase
MYLVWLWLIVKGECMNKLVIMLGLSIPAMLSAQMETKGEQNNRKLKVGEKVTINLPSNPSTGYSWHVKDDGTGAISSVGSNKSSIIKYQSRYIAPDQPKQGPVRVGVPGHEEWEFIASRPGSARVTIEYIRTWEPLRPAQSKELIFDVGAR